jgi:hypothetical protein
MSSKPTANNLAIGTHANNTPENEAPWQIQGPRSKGQRKRKAEKAKKASAGQVEENASGQSVGEEDLSEEEDDDGGVALTPFVQPHSNRFQFPSTSGEENTGFFPDPAFKTPPAAAPKSPSFDSNKEERSMFSSDLSSYINADG